MKLEHEPADKLFVDFAGKPLHYVDHSTGELIRCQIFVSCLPFSDYCFAMVPSQRITDFLYAIGCYLDDIGGTPAVLVPVNLSLRSLKQTVMNQSSIEHWKTLLIIITLR